MLPATAAQARRELRAALAAAAEEKRFVCRRKQWCAGVTPAGWRIVTLDDPAHLGVACDSADFVVAPQFLRRETCRSGARLITAASLRRTGALEITPARDGDPADRVGYRITAGHRHAGSAMGPASALRLAYRQLRRPAVPGIH